MTAFNEFNERRIDMSQQVASTAMRPFGAASSTLNVLPQIRVTSRKLSVANVMDRKPMVSITPFDKWMSLVDPPWRRRR